MAAPDTFWTRQLHGLWMAALSAATDDELDERILSTLGDLPGAVSAWTARLDSRSVVLQSRGSTGSDLPPEVRDAFGAGLGQAEVTTVGPGVRMLLTAGFAVPGGS